jgi:hypothetical protein
MRTKLTFLFVIISFVASAQFTIQPQIGLENSKTTVKYNDLPSFAPMGLQYSPRIALRLDYKFKQGHGPFMGIATSSPVVSFNFTDPQTANTAYNASRQNLQIRFEGGYQLSTKPIYFSKTASAPVTRNMGAYNSSGHKCGGSEQNVSADNSADHIGCRHYCERSCTKTSKTTTASRTQNKGWYMRIQPSAGVAFIPTVKNELEIKSQNNQTNYLYKAGAWNTAFITGAGFEFGENASSKFIVSINYLKGIGNMDTKTINTVSTDKTINTSLSSNASSWNVSVGIPISFNKPKTVTVVKHYEKTIYQGRCGQHYRLYQQ